VLVNEALGRVTDSIARSRRYRRVCETTVRRLAVDALRASGGNEREAAKRTKRALHQICGAYLPASPSWPRLRAELDACPDEPEALRQTLRVLMQQHASTRERLPVLEQFWNTLRPRLGATPRVLDVGCGLAPLSAPWQGLAPGARYAGVDIDAGLVELVRAALDRIGIEHDIRLGDALDHAPLPESDVALALKLLPTLERQAAGAGLALLDWLPAPKLVVSFPTRSLGGQARGMEANYSRGFEALLAQRPWRAERLELPGELVYLVQR
jgi:16S rRNA (guanine(1405)-N(7))-methyltransferase